MRCAASSKGRKGLYPRGAISTDDEWWGATAKTKITMKIRDFINSVQGLSDNTRTAYEQTLWQLHSNIRGDEPTKEDIHSFLSLYTTSSLHRHKAAIKAYLEFTHPGVAWPFNRRQFTPQREEILRYVPVDMVMKLIDAAENEDDRMFILTLFMLGCRITELRGIEAKDITPAGVSVLAKGNTFLLKVITRDFYPQISSYSQGKKGKIFPQTYSYYYKLLKTLGAQVGFPNISPHMLRHARAVDLLKKKMSLAFVQQFLGHANINTTARYLLVTGGELGDILEEVEAAATKAA